MATDVKLPDLGENLSEGGVLELKVKPGDAVAVGDILLVIEAEKSTVEVPSDVAGTVAEIVVKKGETVKSGQLLMRVEAGAAAPASKPAAKPEVKEDLRTSPAAPKDEGKKEEKAAPTRNGDGAHKPAVKAAGRVTKGEYVLAGPATRSLARKLNVDLFQVPGSGPRGRVTQDDVRSFAGTPGEGGGRSVGVAVPPLPDFGKWGPVEAQPLELIRRKTAEQMALAWSQVPHVTQYDLADLTDLEAFRRGGDPKGPKLTVTAFALKAAAIALKEFPHVNASLDLAGGRLVKKQYVHIGVAVDTDRGLLVPVIRDVDKKSLRELANELTQVAEKARAKKLSIDDMKGGCFTISNLGGIGGVGFTPIVNWPEVAILGLSRARLEPQVYQGKIEPRLMMTLSLSYDHRVVDGADGARFCRRIAAMLESPLQMLVDA